ncbi:MAG: hypothetical protein II248_04015 [Paludibacteraceae bacterium]|nr:hypothetical protein [Paludibacteraceae bacterium]
MKRLFIILIVLCPYISYGHLQAQMYSTSSRMHHSYSTGGTVEAPSHVEFRSTSVYNSNIRNTQQKCYSTAPMNVANGTVKTIASSIQGGVLSSGDSYASGPQRIRGRQNTMAPPTETPIGDGWDVALLLTLLCAGYALYCYKKNKKKMA